jgi:hypothetical protein
MEAKSVGARLRGTRSGDDGANMGDMTELAERQTERSKVESWRLHVLLDAGYPLTLAERVAGSEADLHQAVELVLAGCDPRVAAEILL